MDKIRRLCECGEAAIAQTYDMGVPLCEKHLEVHLDRLIAERGRRVEPQPDQSGDAAYFRGLANGRAQSAIESQVRIEALIEDFRNLSGIMEFVGMHCEDGWKELIATHCKGGRR